MTRLIFNMIDKSVIMLEEDNIIEMANFSMSASEIIRTFRGTVIDVVIVFDMPTIDIYRSNQYPIADCRIGDKEYIQYIDKQTFNKFFEFTKEIDAQELQIYSMLNYATNSRLMATDKSTERTYLVSTNAGRNISIKIKGHHCQSVDTLTNQQVMNLVSSEETAGEIINLSNYRKSEEVANMLSLEKQIQNYTGFLDSILSEPPLYAQSIYDDQFVDYFSKEYQETLITPEVEKEVIKGALASIVEIRKIRWKADYSRLSIALAVILSILIAITGSVGLFLYNNRAFTQAKIDSVSRAIEVNTVLVDHLDKLMGIRKKAQEIDMKQLFVSLYKFIPSENIKEIYVDTGEKIVEVLMDFESDEEVNNALQNIHEYFRLHPLEDDGNFEEGKLRIKLDYVNH